VYGFLTTAPNTVVEPIHPKAIPVILTTNEERDVWMRAGIHILFRKRDLGKTGSHPSAVVAEHQWRMGSRILAPGCLLRREKTLSQELAVPVRRPVPGPFL
jgi:hypothetical protein